MSRVGAKDTSSLTKVHCIYSQHVANSNRITKMQACEKPIKYTDNVYKRKPGPLTRTS